MTNRKTDDNADNKLVKKAYLEWLNLRQKGISSQVLTNKGINIVADKIKRLDIGKINS